MSNEAKLISCARASAFVRVNERTLRRWFAAGLVPGSRRVNGRWYIDDVSLRQFIRADKAALADLAEL